MSLKICAKFRCTSVKKIEGGQEVVEMSPVTSGSDDNKTWSKYTPCGSLSMTITAEGAVGHFEPGRQYFLDFTPAE